MRLASGLDGGAIKRHLSPDTTLAGQEVFQADDPGQPAGMVVNSAPRPEGGGWALLAEVKLAALEGAPLHLGGLDGPILRQKSLPYEVPITNEA